MSFTKRPKLDNSQASKNIEEFRKVLHKARRIVVLVGHAIGHESTTGTQVERRGWHSLDASPEAFSSNPSLVWQLYHARRRRATRMTHTDLHTLLVKLSIPSFRTSPSIAPKSKSYHLISSSTDRLISSALASIPSRKLASQNPQKDDFIQMNGGILDVQCTKCEWRAEDVVSSLCEALAKADVEKEGWNPEENVIPNAELPRCPACGELARPGMVLPGERPPRLAEIDKIIKKADICIVVGDSLVRHPAATYVAHMRERGGLVAVFAQSAKKSDEGADFLFEGPVEQMVSTALARQVCEDNVLPN